MTPQRDSALRCASSAVRFCKATAGLRADTARPGKARFGEDVVTREMRTLVAAAYLS